MYLVAIASLALLTFAIWGVLRQVVQVGYIRLVQGAGGDPKRWWTPTLSGSVNVIAASAAVQTASYITTSFVGDAHIAFAAIGACFVLLTISRQTKDNMIAAYLNDDWRIDSQASDERNSMLRGEHVQRLGNASCMGALLGFAITIGALLIWPLG